MIKSAVRAEESQKRRSREDEDSQGGRRSKHEKYSHGHRRHHRHHHHSCSRDQSERSPEANEKAQNKRFPSLELELPPLSFPAFKDYEIQEAPDFDTSCDEQEPENDVKVREESSKPYTSPTTIDRLRGEDGGIDLGLNRTDWGRIETENDYHDKKRRKMINYDMHGGQSSTSGTTAVVEARKNLLNESIDQIPYTFGDRGSTWRMMKLGKLDSGYGRGPSKAKIFEQYATLWDYDLACMERDELEARKHKPKDEWIYTPPTSFMKKRRSHMMANRQAMREILQAKDEEEKMKESSMENGVNQDNVLYMKKHGDIKMSKSKKLRNELKLAHLTALEQSESENYLTTISREQIESLTNSP